MKSLKGMDMNIYQEGDSQDFIVPEYRRRVRRRGRRRAQRRARSTRIFLGIMLLVIGAFAVVWPWIMDQYYDRKSGQIMQSYLESTSMLSVLDETDLQTVEQGALESPLPAIEDSGSDSSKAGYSIQGRNLISQSEAEKNKSIQNKWPVEATLMIPKIAFEMPVIRDATEAHLNVSVSSIAGTPKPWEHGNYAIAGHRSLSYGRHFNRLNELGTGDEIIVIDTRAIQYLYRVYKVIIVHESEVWVLDSGNKDEITLITCHPINEKYPKTRLIVKAQR